MANVSGKIKVFKRDFEYKSEKGETATRTFYSTTVSGKDKDGNYVNGYMDVKFPNKEPKAKELTDHDGYSCIDIEATDAFLSARETKSGIRFEIVVLKWKKAESK